MAQCTKKAANAQTNLEKADRVTNRGRERDGGRGRDTQKMHENASSIFAHNKYQLSDGEARFSIHTRCGLVSFHWTMWSMRVVFLLAILYLFSHRMCFPFSHPTPHSLHCQSLASAAFSLFVYWARISRAFPLYRRIFFRRRFFFILTLMIFSVDEFFLLFLPFSPNENTHTAHTVIYLVKVYMSR